MSTSDDCGYCYGTMGICPVCGPFEYAPSETIGGQRDAGYHVDGWGLSGRMPDWHDSANERGWTRKDVCAFLDLLYEGAGERLNELLLGPSKLRSNVSNVDHHADIVTAASVDWDSQPILTNRGNRNERRKAAALARRA